MTGHIELARRPDLYGTPVIIGQSIRWRDARRVEADRAAFLAAFARWKQDWERLDADRYLAHYSSRFRSQKAPTLRAIPVVSCRARKTSAKRSPRRSWRAMPMPSWGSPRRT